MNEATLTAPPAHLAPTTQRPAPDRPFLGHPRGLATLAFTEMWERFSYYGMTALLALYITKQLLLPGHAEHVVGLSLLRGLFEFRGPMTNVAFASLLYGWHAGFSLAAAMMLLALAVYLAGQRNLPNPRPTMAGKADHAPLGAAERKRLRTLIVAIALTVPAAIGFGMVGGIGMIWVDRYVDLATPLGTVPLIWAILDGGGMGVAFMWYWPVLLALVSGNAPHRIRATVMGVVFLALFTRSVIGGWVGTFYDQMGPAAFWTLNAAIAGAGALVTLVCGPVLTRRLAPPSSHPDDIAAARP